MQEEENSRLAAAKRRLQRELDELSEQNETLQRDLASARKRYVHCMAVTSMELAAAAWCVCVQFLVHKALPFVYIDVPEQLLRIWVCVSK